MRARNIKPGFWRNEDLVELPFEHRLLFVGLWMLADREGRLEDRPKRIKMEVFPSDDVNVEVGIQDLMAMGLVERYVSEGVKVILITKFAEHQSPHHSEKRSDLPGKDGFDAVKSPKKGGGKTEGSPASDSNPPEKAATTNEEGSTNNGESQTDTGESTVGSPEVHGRSTVESQNSGRRNRPDSLNPDSLNPDSIEKPIVTSPGDETAQPEAVSAADPDDGKKPAYPPEFEMTWARYPKRPGSNPKNKAFGAWRARLKDGADPATILSGVIRYANFIKATKRQNTEFVMQAVRFFGTSCEYENEWTPPEDTPPPSGGPKTMEPNWSQIDYRQGVTQDGRF
ncbi:hypothetical protein [Marinobacter sp. BGYM27]|uniref:hypothetical protein n=1 Tax=Marinobacter sp. BGYM27 TaxID=2975597 RepID=UPI0021A5C815|nr:hypothetical protein [Marinobacter sp. BGYM27]MDG5498940.1 hypothetical protein [Marinobacter sp. BGYM27]